LGGNRGPVEETLRWALGRLDDLIGPLRVAPLYRTAAISFLPQPDYLNTAAVAATRLPADAVLAFAKALEYAAGRRPAPRATPRPLDIDLLLYGAALSASPELVLPHPRLAARRFALAPLAAIAPDLPVPPAGVRVAELLARLPPGERVERVEWSGGSWR
jgi:2-amino-4-hydroxy-6-hydroxymethyldihydropteridine diphosphokinase